MQARYCERARESPVRTAAADEETELDTVEEDCVKGRRGREGNLNLAKKSCVRSNGVQRSKKKKA
jgi:hypothetical protein